MRANLVVFLCASVSGFFAFLYQLVVVRCLDTSDFGVFNSFLALIVICVVPLGTFQVVITTLVSRIAALEDYHSVRHFFYGTLKKAFVLAFICSSGLLVLSPAIRGFLHVSSNDLIVFLVLTVFFHFLLPVTYGSVQGLEKFKSLGFLNIAHSFTRLTLGLLILPFFPLTGMAIGIFPASAFMVFLLSYWIVNRFMKLKVSNPGERREEGEAAAAESVLKSFFPALVGITSFMILTNADMVLVRHFFGAHDTGVYGIAQLVGKIVLFFTASVSVVMIPVVTRFKTQGKDHFLVLKACLGIALLLSLVVIIPVFSFPSLVLKVISGKSGPELVRLAKLFSLLMGGYSLSQVFLYYYISIRKYAFVFQYALFALGLILLITIFHGTLATVALMSLAVSMSILAVNLVLVSRLRGAGNA